MDWFSVHMSRRAPETLIGEAELDVAGDRLMDLLAAHDGVVSVGGGAWSATVSVQAEQARSAADMGGALIEARAAEAGLPGMAGRPPGGCPPRRTRCRERTADAARPRLRPRGG